MLLKAGEVVLPEPGSTCPIADSLSNRPATIILENDLKEYWNVYDAEFRQLKDSIGLDGVTVIKTVN